MLFAALLIGLLVGGLAAWLVARARAVASLAASTADAEALRTELEIERRSTEEKLSLVERANAQWEKRFEALSAEALKSNTSSFLELARTQLSPISKTLDAVKDHAEQLERARQHAYGSLVQQVKTLADGQEKLRSETGNLVTALRSPHVRGRWGEIQLKRVVELAG